MKKVLFALFAAIFSLSCVKQNFADTGVFPIVFDKTVNQLKIDVDAANVEIRPSSDSSSRVDLQLSYSGREPEYDVVVDGTTLKITLDCENTSNCEGKFTIEVPKNTTAALDLGAGNVQITSMGGPIDLHSGAGNVKLDQLSGELTLRTGAGNITATRISSPEIEARTGAGNIKIQSTQNLEQARLNSGAGNVELTVPNGRYKLSLSTGIGNQTIRNITTDDSAPRSISANSGVGNVVIRGV